MTSAQITEAMAFDRLQSKDYRDKIKSDAMSEEERNLQIMRLLGGA